MKKSLKIALLASSAIAIAAGASANSGLAKLINNSNNWAHPSGNFELHRHSKLKQINIFKLKQLVNSGKYVKKTVGNLLINFLIK